MKYFTGALLVAFSGGLYLSVLSSKGDNSLLLATSLALAASSFISLVLINSTNKKGAK